MVSFVSRAALADRADAERHQDRGDQRADQEVSAARIGDHDAGEDGVRERVAHEGESAQGDEDAGDAADDADQHDREEGVLHEGEAERLKNQSIMRASPSDNQLLRPEESPGRRSMARRLAAVITSLGGPAAIELRLSSRI